MYSSYVVSIRLTAIGEKCDIIDVEDRHSCRVFLSFVYVCRTVDHIESCLSRQRVVFICLPASILLYCPPRRSKSNELPQPRQRQSSSAAIFWWHPFWAPRWACTTTARSISRVVRTTARWGRRACSPTIELPTWGLWGRASGWILFPRGRGRLTVGWNYLSSFYK